MLKSVERECYEQYSSKQKEMKGEKGRKRYHWWHKTRATHMAWPSSSYINERKNNLS
jgi:hypothetical protein